MIKNRIKKEWKDLKDIFKSDKKILKANRIISNGIVKAILLFLIDIFLFLLFNYIINVFCNVGKMFQDMDNMASYMGLNNILFSVRNFASSGLIKTLYGFFLIAVIILDIFLSYDIKTAFSEEAINKQQKGDSKLATLEDIRKQYKEIDECGTVDESRPGFLISRDYEGRPGFLISRYENKLYIDTNTTNNLLIGITRSGKGELYVFPSIEIYSRAKIKPSMIINDMKGELYKSNQKTRLLQSRGYLVYFINLQNPEEGDGYNPLESIINAWESGNPTFAEELTLSFAWQIFDPDSATGNEKYFAETGAAVTEALILAHVEDALRLDEEENEKRKAAFDRKVENFKRLDEEMQNEVRKQYKLYLSDVTLDNNVTAIPDDAVFEKTHENRKKINMYSIVNTYMELVNIPVLDMEGRPTGKTYLDLFFTERPQGDRAKMQYMSTGVASGKTKGNILSTMNAKLNIYTMESIAKLTAESSFKLEDIGFGDKPIAVFLGIPYGDTSKHQIALTFIRQSALINSNLCWDGGKCKRPVKYIEDEIGNMPKIDKLVNMVTASAGCDITYDFYIQSYSQFDDIYGQGAAKTIRSNCGNLVYIRTDDLDTLEDISKKVGRRTIVTTQRNGSKFSLKKMFMENTEEQRLLTTEQLKALKDGETVVLRTMKTKDNNGDDVERDAIFNSIESGKRMKFRYEYLEDYLPTPTTISLREVNDASRAGIGLKTRIWDYNKSFEFIKRDRSNDVQSLRIEDMHDFQQEAILQVLNEIMDEKQKKENEPLQKMKLRKVENIIQTKQNTENFTKAVQNSLLSLIDFYLKMKESTDYEEMEREEEK